MTYRRVDDLIPVDGVHVHRMGMAIWLFLFLRSKTDAYGLVNGGQAITYRLLFDMIPNCVPEDTLRKWLTVLRANGYVEIELLGAGMRIRLVESKKWPACAPSDDNEKIEVAFFPRMMGPRSTKTEAIAAEVDGLAKKKLAIMGRRVEQKKIS